MEIYTQNIWWIAFLLFSVPGCKNIHLIGDGNCNDETNNEICGYDGGDCCLYPDNKGHCSDCICYLKGFCATGFHPFVGNGICDNELENIAECSFDGLDCCGKPHKVGNSFCNDELNNGQCHYDGGDCCRVDCSQVDGEFWFTEENFNF